jgi:shikimate kinase
MNLHCVLVGMPGAGKSTIGRQLARRLGVPFHDSDYHIEQRLGCSIRAYFESHGEPAFRDVEEQVLQELLSRSELSVVSTGGGAVLRAANRERLRTHATVFYLRAAPEEIFRRIRHDTVRPLLQVASPLERLRELYAQRDPLYRETAHYTLETGRPSMSMLVSMIAMQLDMLAASHSGDTAPQNG